MRKQTSKLHRARALARRQRQYARRVKAARRAMHELYTAANAFGDALQAWDEAEPREPFLTKRDAASLRDDVREVIEHLEACRDDYL